MKTHKFLILSVVGNVALASAMTYQIRQKRQPTVVAPAETVVSTPAPQVPTRVHRTVTAVDSNGGAAFDWRQVESEDYKQFIANLRSIACPEETIRDIILADVRKLYAPKFAALHKPEQPRNYWESENLSRQKPDRDQQQKVRDLEKEKNQLLKELLGVDPREEQKRLASGDPDNDERFGFLAKEKQAQLRELLNRFSEKEQDVYAKANGNVDADIQKELASIRKERRDEMTRLLSPQELEQYDLRQSEDAQRLKSSLAGFNQTEEEFQKIFRLRKAYQDEYGTGGSLIDKNDPVQRERWQQARKDLEDKLRLELGEQRYADYTRAKDPSYQEIARLTQRFDVPAESVNNLYEMKKTTEEQVRQLQSNAALSEEQKAAALAAIQSEATKSVADMLGDKVFKAYQSAGGRWIRNLKGGRVPGAVQNIAVDATAN